MKKHYHKKPIGDTLIEVIFAFAILGTIIGFAFTGVIQGRKSAIAAQQRSQALLIAQAQSSAILSYRSALPWDENGGTPSFLGGQTGGSSAVSLSNTGRVFCVWGLAQNPPPPPPQTNYKTWALLDQTNSNNITACNGLANPLTVSEPSNNKVIRIVFEGYGSDEAGGVCTNINECGAIRAEVGVYWTDPYGQTANVKNFVTLTKSQ